MQINHVILSGRLTTDPDIRSVHGSEEQVANFTLANNRVFSSNGQRRESVAFIAIVAWGALAKVAQQYLKKGTETVIEGRIEQDRWEDEQGHKKSKTKVFAVRIHLTPKSGLKEEGE